MVVAVHELIEATPPAVLVPLDAAGLALFAVTGAAKADAAGVRPLLAALLGAVSAVGGGVMRDVLLNVVPAVLRSDIYAVAALLGAATTVVGIRRGLPDAVAMALGALMCVGLRLVAVGQGWSLPRVID